jgi:glutathione peroxidase
MNLVYFFSALISYVMLQTPSSFHEFKIQQLNSDEIIDFSQYAGKKILIVNVASECGFTRQYDDLEEFSKEFNDKVVVVGFPCNQFGGQEPGTEATIQEFCRLNFGVSFPMTTKVEVKGKNQHPIYSWLTQQSQNGVGDYNVSWNFNKFLIDEKGKLMGWYTSSVNPYDDELLSYFE